MVQPWHWPALAAYLGAGGVTRRLGYRGGAAWPLRIGRARFRGPLGYPAGLKFLLEIYGRGVYDSFRTEGAELLFDVGANVGGLAIQRCLAQPKLRVVALEPRASTCATLRANIATNALAARIHVIEAAADERAGRIPLGLPVGSTMGVVRTPDTIDPTGPVVDVRALTLDELLEDHGSPDAVKIDVEGHEAAVLRGAARTLREAKTVVLEAHTPDRRDTCARLLEQAGLRVRAIHPLLFAERA